MNHQRIIEHFRDKILSLQFTDVTADDIQIPNVYFERKDRKLFFEITLGESAPQDYVETADLRRFTVDIDVIVPTGASTARLNNIAERLRRIYSPVLPEKSSFRLSGNIFVCRAVQVTPVTRISRFQIDYTTEGVKICVKFTFDVYSKEL